MSTNSTKLTIPIKGTSCASCVSHVTRALESVRGVEAAYVNLATEEATLDMSPGATRLDKLVEAVEDAGY